MKRWKIIVLSMLLAITAGCAIDNRTFATRNMAFDDGKKLIAAGQFESGIEKLDQARSEEPENRDIQTVVLRLREEVTGKLMFEAENLRFSGQLDRATQAFQRILRLFPFNERAKEGLESIALDRQHIAKVDTARELLRNGETAKAETLVRAILQENPQQTHARQLIAEINLNLSRPEVTHLALESAFKKNVTMEFKDTDLKSVFELMSRTAGINFVFDKDIRQDTKISIFVRNNTIEDILKLILTTNQMAYKVLNNNSLLIYPNTPAKLKDYQELVVRSFQIAHTDVKQMVAMVRGIVKAKDIYVNEQLNLFIMRDTLEAIRLTERLVSLNDYAEPEVMLEVTIIDVSRGNKFLLGPNFPQSLQASYAAAGATLNPAAGIVFKSFGFDGLNSFGMPAQVSVDFLQNFSAGDILANPKIRVNNKEKAKIHVGTKEPFFTANVQSGAVGGIVTATPTFIDLGVKLDVEPRIGLNDDVTLKVTLEVSSLLDTVRSPQGATAPRVGTRNAETLLTLKDGETQVIAGLLDNRERRNVKGLAGLINIPGLDRLTSNQDIDKTKNEVILLITPRIIRNIPRPTNLESEYHFGTASEAGKLPVKIERTKAQSLAITPGGSGQGSARGGANPFAAPVDEDVPNPFAKAAAAAASSTPSLTLQAPTNVGLDKEFSVNVRLVGAKATTNTELQLSYDSGSFELLDGGAKSGSRSIRLGKDQIAGLATQLRFKVIATAAGTAEVSIQSANGEDIEHGDVVDVTLPPPATINFK